VATVLVDAENVRRSLWPNIPREELEQRCREWGRRQGHEVIVVWEGAETADDRIAWEVRQLAPPVWVVTSDRELRERVADRVERIIGGGTFARELPEALAANGRVASAPVLGSDRWTCPFSQGAANTRKGARHGTWLGTWPQTCPCPRPSGEQARGRSVRQAKPAYAEAN
jgi:hypothetical protein